jgi:hypothetical protein
VGASGEMLSPPVFASGEEAAYAAVESENSAALSAI